MKFGNGEELPRYRELPVGPGGGWLGWHLFGPEDQLGLFNLQTPERVIEATRLVRTGKVFPLSPRLNLVDPPLFNRGRYQHHLLQAADGFDDYLDHYYLQGSAHWDSLAHVPYTPDAYYNGVTANQIVEGNRNTIDQWSARGIVGRAVLLDLTKAETRSGRPFTMDIDKAFTVADLESAQHAAGVRIREGDVLLVHTGYLGWYAQQSPLVRAELADEWKMRAPGLEHTEAMAEYLWDLHVCAIAADNPAVEQWPMDDQVELAPFGSLHRILIGSFGMALGELWWLSDLARECTEDDVYEMLVVAAPLHLPGGIGSPANAIAIK